MSEIRQDMITGNRVIVATDRARRPETFLPAAGGSIQLEEIPAHVDNCPFCEGNEYMTPPEKAVWPDGGLPDSPGWKVRVVPNKFPAAEIINPPSRLQEETGKGEMPSYGEHEVIIETPAHNRHPGEISAEQMHLILKACRQRMISMARNPLLRSVTIYRNHKKGGGASLEHPHSQLIALPVVPEGITRELEGARRYFLEKGRCPFCVMTGEDYYNGDYLVCENRQFVALVPYAARLPFETWILPRKHCSSFALMENEELQLLALIMNEVLRRLSYSLNDPPYNYYLHSAPLHTGSLSYYHWHLEIIPRLTAIAGFEMASGIYINETVPGEAARYLREAEGYVYA